MQKTILPAALILLFLPMLEGATSSMLASVHRSVLAGSSPLQPAGLACDYIVNPLGIDDLHPRLAWAFKAPDTAHNLVQSAYEILVGDNEADIRKLKGNAWTSGKIISSENSQIEYKGSPLRSFTRYYWRVKVYDSATGAASDWSEPAWFETAMLNPEDWKGQWIGDGKENPAKSEEYFRDDRMPLLRKEFNNAKQLSSARLYISGLGYYEAYLNGKKIGLNVLDPGFTTYKRQVLYVTHDITALLKDGKNTMGIMLGNGWWNPLPMLIFGRIDLRNFQQTGRPCVKAEIHLHYTDGTEETIATDETWQTAPGPVIRNSVYLGEKYDARLEQHNWCDGGPDSSVVDNAHAGNARWKGAVYVDGPSGTLAAQMQPAIQVTSILTPIEITEPKPDSFIVDMGQNFAGVVAIKVKGKAGTKISMRYGEAIYPDGTLNVNSTVATQIRKGGLKGGPGAPETAWQEDDYILKGEGMEDWWPRFTFHGFRYVEITGWPGKPLPGDILGLRMNSNLQQEGDFSCSNDMFNQLHRSIQWTFLSNVFSVQSDCPGREKMGYGADMVVTSGAFLYNFNMANFYGKAIRDFANEQQPDGAITEIAPYTGIADEGYGGESGPLGWELNFAYLQKQLYDFYGDRRVIEQYYGRFQRQIDFLRRKSVNGLFDRDIGDHASLDVKPVALSASAFYYEHVCLAAQFAGILHKVSDSMEYGALAEKIRRAIIDRFQERGTVEPLRARGATDRFDNGTQAAQLFALYYGFAPQKDSVFAALIKEFERKKWHLSTGIFATKMLFDVMRENDSNELAYRLANQRDFPGWGYMMAKGATTLWETWDGSESLNHPMFGSIDEWFYRSLLGINAAAPGFRRIKIKPQPAGDLQWARGSYHSINGLIGCHWKKNGKAFVLDVSVPPNTRAEIWIPARAGEMLKENGRLLMGNSQALGVLRYENGYAVVETGSGNYSFDSENAY